LHSARLAKGLIYFESNSIDFVQSLIQFSLLF
jgi:hypothetical protein